MRDTEANDSEGRGSLSPRMLSFICVGILLLFLAIGSLLSAYPVDWSFAGPVVAVVIGFFVVSIRYRKLGDDHLVAALEACALLMVFSTGYMLATYLLPEHAPFGFWDEEFAAFDEAMGLTADDVVTWSRGVPWFDELLANVYYLFFYQYALFVVYAAGIRQNGWRAFTVVAEMFVCALVGLALFAIFPSLNAVWFYGHEDLYHTRVLVAHLIQLRDGTFAGFQMGTAQGLIQFPSFHVAIALILGWDLRREPGWVFAIGGVWTALMVLSAVTTGGHYIVDLFGGAFIAATGIVAVRLLCWDEETYRARLSQTD